MATAIVRLSTAVAPRRSSSVWNARSGSSSSDAIEQRAMWVMMKKVKMRKTRKMMMKIRAGDEEQRLRRSRHH
jgi:hypothetical protein